MDVLIFGGQSNMQGQTEVLSENEVVENAYEYKYLTDTLSPLKNPAGEDIRFDGTAGYPVLADTNLSVWHNDNVLGASCYGNTNMVASFCRSYIKSTGHTVAAVHAAKGSTVIGAWLPETECYRMLCEKSRGAIKKVNEISKVDNVYFIWLQGESDAIEGCSKDEYIIQLKMLCSGLKKDVGITQFCVIRVGRFTNDERDLAIMDAQSEMCRTDPDFVMLTEQAAEMCKEAKYMNPFVEGHYSASGQEKLGELAGYALAKISKQRSDLGQMT